jgi:hypothetical protein
VRTPEQEIRDSVVMGHRLKVHLDGNGCWGVAVDGEEILGGCGSAYSAWAVGAAESYRQGRILRSASADD